MKTPSVPTIALIVGGIIAIAIAGAWLITGHFPFSGEFWQKVSNNTAVGVLAVCPFILAIIVGYIYWGISLKKKK
jgi:high-affinity nickel permease